ncbi:MAG: hypothetical protein K6B13_07770 [Prevotella sp.]|nr:hypothetical protein [Prevotella sp.]
MSDISSKKLFYCPLCKNVTINKRLMKMKKTATVIYLFIVLGCSMGTKESGTTDNAKDHIEESDYSKNSEEYIESLAKCEIPKISLPFYLDSTNSYYPEMHGMINPHAREDIMDASFFPPIPDLYFKSCFEVCPIDCCKAERAVLAIVPLMIKRHSCHG